MTAAGKPAGRGSEKLILLARPRIGMDFWENPAAGKKKIGCRSRSELGETRVSGLGVPDECRSGVIRHRAKNAIHCDRTTTASW